MTFATGIGSVPGDDQHAYDEAVGIVLGELGDPPGLPYLPEVPGRGAVAGMTGRTLALLSDVDGLGVDLQPAGWRITGGGSGVDHRRARSLLAQDLDTLEERADGYAGAFKVQLAGPWTLAATVERPRGDRVLADPGLRRELAQALAEAVRGHVADVRRRLPGATRIVVQVDEPALGAVLDAQVPTASGFGKHRTIHPPEASEHLDWLFAAITAAGAVPWAHTCAGDAPLGLLRGAGARGLAVDLAVITAAGHDVLAEALEAGEDVVLGVLPTGSQGGPMPDDAAATERVLRWLDLVGLDPAVVGERLGVSAGCGLAGGAVSVRASLALAVAVARHLS